VAALVVALALASVVALALALVAALVAALVVALVVALAYVVVVEAFVEVEELVREDDDVCFDYLDGSIFDGYRPWPHNRLLIDVLQFHNR